MKTTLLATMLVTAATAWCAKPFVIPELRDWSDNAAAGAFALSEDTRVVIPEDACDALARYAQTFADDLGLPLVREASGFWHTVTFTAESAEPGDILLRVVPDDNANPEAYTLTAGKSGIVIQAPTPLGAFWGTRAPAPSFRSSRTRATPSPAARPRTGRNTPSAASCSTAAASPSPSPPCGSWPRSARITS